MAIVYNKDERLNIKYISDILAYGKDYSGQAVRDWVLDLACRGVTFKRQTPYSSRINFYRANLGSHEMIHS